MWVISELENGQIMDVTFELLGAAKELDAKMGEKCCAVLICSRRAACSADCWRR